LVDYGVQIEPQFGFEYDDVRDIAEVGLKNGLSSLWFSDHFMLDADATDKTLLDPWLLMTALVRENPKIRVGSLVFCNSYRQPSLTAKMAATLDHLSGGRFEFGIGAGWKKIEYNAYGYEFPPDLVRIEQLREALQIIKGTWSNDKFTFKGKHYSVNDIVSFPKPLQKPRPTIWIGTMYAKDKMLELTAQYGDGINIAWSFTPAMCEEIFTRLDAFCEKNNRDPKTMKKSVGLWTRAFTDPDEKEQKIIETAEKRGIPVEKYRERINNAFWGTPSELNEKLDKYRALDITHFIFMLPYGEEKEQIELLGSKVL
jgi:alkanesulfonate monooxygenase SsuD/methylene tetrahydromethanopterin reductase-like flavin-dependent oxidoreductase (luciferase family)